MKRRARPQIEVRRPVYIGCEGASEVGYAGFLQDLIRASDLPVHLQIDELGPGAGDPLSRIELAVLRLRRLQQKRGAPVDKFALLDADQAERDHHRAAQARHVAEINGILIVWQRPCFEAMLLRHFAGKETIRPPDTPRAERNLEREWPDYRKPMSRADLARRIDRDAVLRAAGVEAELHRLLQCVGLL